VFKRKSSIFSFSNGIGYLASEAFPGIDGFGNKNTRKSAIVENKRVATGNNAIQILVLNPPIIDNKFWYTRIASTG